MNVSQENDYVGNKEFQFSYSYERTTNEYLKPKRTYGRGSYSSLHISEAAEYGDVQTEIASPPIRSLWFQVFISGAFGRV